MQTSTLSKQPKMSGEQADDPDLQNYSGNLYVIAAITSSFERNWRHVSGNFTLPFTKWEIKLSNLINRNCLIEELAPDYSYAVVGHPEKYFLYILSREKSMQGSALREIINRCRENGYDMKKLRKIVQP